MLKNGKPANATTDSCFGLCGPCQCGVAPGVDQQLLTDQQLHVQLRQVSRACIHVHVGA